MRKTLAQLRADHRALKTLPELRQARRAIKLRMKAISDQAEAEARATTEDEEGEFADLRTAYGELDARVTRLEEVADTDDEADDEVANRSINPRASEAARDPARPHAPAILRGNHSYRLTRALDQLAEGKSVNGLEGEWSAEMRIRSGGKSPQGIYVPHHWGNEKRDGVSSFNRRTVTTSTSPGSVGVAVQPTMIEYLYARSALGDLGATYLTDMEGQFALPRQNVTSTSYWFSEGNAPTISTATMDQVVFSPKSLGAYTDLSRKFLKTSSIDGEMFARNDLARMVALGVDAAGFTGSGVGAVPRGLANNPNINVVSLGTDSGPATWSGVVKQEALIATANADVGRLGYATSPLGRGALKTTKVDPTSPGFPIFLAAADGTINSQRLVATSQIPNTFSQGASTNCYALFYGNWEDLIISMFGAVDVLVDRITGGASGTLRVIVIQDADIQPRHDQSFSMMIYKAAA